MALQYLRNALGATNSTTSFSITLPTTAAGDILILEFAHRGTGNGTIAGTSVSTGGLTWSLKHSQTFGTSFSGKTYWTRATGEHAGQTVTGTGLTNSCAAIVTVYSGALASGDPLDDATIVGEANASGNETQAEITTATDGAFVVLVVVNSPDYAISSQACTSPGALTERAERLSTGGTDSSVSHASAEKATAGATGAFTWAQTNAASGSWAYAITPLALSTFTYSGSGGAVAGGTAATLFATSRSYAGSGGANSGGTAATTWQRLFAYTVSGVSVASGAAATAYEPGTSVFDYAGSGGSVAAGAAESLWQRLFAFDATGGSVAAGAAGVEFSATYAYAATGGAAATGYAATEWQRLFAYATSGGASAAGAASTAYQSGASAAYEFVASGGAMSGGTAATEYAANAPAVVRPIFGRRVRGSIRRRRSRRFSYEGRGGISGGGSAPCEFAPDYTDDVALALMLAAA